MKAVERAAIQAGDSSFKERSVHEDFDLKSDRLLVRFRPHRALFARLAGKDAAAGLGHVLEGDATNRHA